MSDNKPDANKSIDKKSVKVALCYIGRRSRGGDKTTLSNYLKSKENKEEDK